MLNACIKWLQKTRIFPYLYWVLYATRLEKFSTLACKKETLHASHLYFSSKQSEIQHILNNLADETSKKVLQKQISFRQYAYPLPLGHTYNPYFPKDIIHLSSQEIFIDCGAFTGDTILRFKRACHGKYKSIIAFEANPISFKQLQAQHVKNCTCLNCGVWDKPDTLLFSSQARETDKLIDTKVERLQQKQPQLLKVPVNAIDNIPACSNMTFLKMDIEGAEINALKGAEKTIRQNSPALAIAIYHSDQDLLNIPLWIMSLGLNYKYYIRHHGVAFAEVIFYAVPSLTNN